jgi:CubicO group peptidase (beta-lactamase class C family)
MRCVSVSKSKWLFYALFTLFVFSCKNQSPAQTAADSTNTVIYTGNVSQALKDSLARFLDVFLPQQRFSGGILVVKNGQTLYERYMGFTGDNRDVAVTDTTPFHVASTSKTVTSTAVLQLIAIGKLNLSDSVTKFFPAFPYPDVTIRHLLNHTSGIRNYAYYFPLAKWNRKVVATNRDVLDVLISSRPLQEFPTGTQFHYSNTNFSLLALIVEEISKLPFPEYAKQYVFTPAGMTHSFILNISNQYRYMPSWTASGRLYDFEYLDAIYGDKNLYTTCRDLRAYDSAIRNNILLPQSFYDSAWQPMSADRHYHDTIEYYGLGWRIKRWSNGNKIVYHNGWWHGNNAVFQRVYQDSAVIIATGNVYNSNIYKLGRLANFFRAYYDQPNMLSDAPPEGEETGVATSDTASAAKKPPVKVKVPEPRKSRNEKVRSKKAAPAKKESAPATRKKAPAKKETTKKRK